MTGLRVHCCALPLLTVLRLAYAPGLAQEKQKLAAEWISSGEAMDATATPSFRRLSNGKALLCDRRKPQAERTLELLDPAPPLVRFAKGLSGRIQSIGTLGVGRLLTRRMAFLGPAVRTACFPIFHLKRWEYPGLHYEIDRLW